MYRSCKTWVIVLTMILATSLAKTPQQLKGEFDAILPAGKKVRMAWCKGGFWRDDMYQGDHDRSIYVVDSDDGVVRELTPPALFPDSQRNCGGFPSITADGSRVIFSEGYSGKVYVINWDGTGLAAVGSFAFLSRYWRNPVDKSDWVTVDNYGIYRVNVDDATQRVLLWNRTDIIRSFFTLSPDGTRLGFMPSGLNEGFLTAGIAPVPNGQFTVADTGGCRVNVAHDNSYDFLFQLPYHRVVRVCDSTGRKKQDFVVADTIATWAGRNNAFNACRLVKVSPPDQFDELRWTNDRNFITFHMYSTNVNPFLFRLSDRHFVSIQDSLGACGYAGNSDAVFLATGPAVPEAPGIRTVPDYQCLINTSTSRTVFVSGVPSPTLSASGLPAGIQVVNGSTAADAFVISGTPTDTGEFDVTLTATNSEGAVSASFTLTVKSANAPPEARAGADTLTRLGRKFYLQGSAVDDGIPNPNPQTVWKMDTSNYAKTATISVPNAMNTLVTFTDTGHYAFVLFANDGAVSDSDTVIVEVRQSIVPMVISPAAGDTIRAGTDIQVSWQVDPPANVQILLSINDGLSYDYTLNSGAAIPWATTTLAWSVPDDITNTTEGRIKVVEYISQEELVQSGRFVVTGGVESSVLRAARGGGVDYRNFEIYSLNGRRLDSGVLARRPGTTVQGIVILRASGKRAGVRRVTVLPR